MNMWSKVKSVEEVKQAIDKKNALVDAWYDAYNWLREATKGKLDKKATRNIFEVHKINDYKWREQEKYLGNGYGWKIGIRDNPYHYYGGGNEKLLFIRVCEEEIASDGYKNLKDVGFFLSHNFVFCQDRCNKKHRHRTVLPVP